MNIRNYILIPFLIFSLAACIKAPTLEERIEGKVGSQRNEELHNICAERAKYHVPGGHNTSYIGHESRMSAICDAMYETNLQEETNAKH
ncbi:MAG: hypothetical protein EBR02_00720 [Alphaproteobacteria bacterium]|nr:hypothetical protein [Alphaproteobacteria bacterium]